MTVEDKVIEAKNNSEAENILIQEYVPFILSCSNKALNRYITRNDDEFSIAIFAFHEALQKYEPSKGAFLTFARLIIKNRLTDYLRKEYRNSSVIPFSALQTNDNDGNIVEFDISDNNSHNLDAKYEIEALTYELSLFSITFFEIAHTTPKTKKTRQNCILAIRYILSDKSLIDLIKDKKYIPAKQIIDGTHISRKILERHRNYIIAAVLIMTGDYEIMQEYFPQLKEAGEYELSCDRN